MPNVVDNPPAPRPIALFMLELGSNGGVLAPVSVENLRTWISKEVAFFNWVTHVQSGPHREATSHPYHRLNNALNQVNDAEQYQFSNPSAFKERIESAKAFLSDTYLNHKLPHSSSKLGKRVESLRQSHPLRATAYLFTQLPNPNGYQFEAKDFDSWSGFIEGLAERTKIADIPKSAFRSATESVELLRLKVETLISERSQELDELHRTYEGLTDSLATKDLNRSESWGQFLATAEKAHSETIESHSQRMTEIEAVFREKMALRGPVEYWSKRQAHHERYSRIFGLISFFMIIVSGATLAIWAAKVLGELPNDATPKAWQVTSLIVVAVFSTWAIRLVVRLFLSHSHLRTDAAERVVMTQTYLALLEENRLSEEKDRSLVLGALFRPASDGMVKDESIPHPMLDALTRLTGKGS